MDNELQHYGIQGMKWGVRRYQNYDGTYTQAGLKRYNKSMDEYEQKRSKETQTRADYKAGKASKSDVNKASSERRTAERQLKKDYKQLKKDRAADKGKELYQNGETIRENKQKQNMLGLAAMGGAFATNYFAKEGDLKLAKATYAYTLGVSVAHSVLKLKNMNDARYLRAYYAHSRPSERSRK